MKKAYLHLEVSEELKHKLKLSALKEGITLKEFITNLINKHTSDSPTQTNKQKWSYQQKTQG